MEARIGGVVFEDWPSSYDECFLIGRNGLRGWYGGDLRREEIPRPFAHGAFDMPGYRAQVVPSISGTLLASSPTVLQAMKTQLLGILSDGSAGRMTVDDERGLTWRDVRLASAPSPEDLDDTSASFTITFWAADPRRYGEAVDFAAGVPASHQGNFPATPRLLIGAGSGGYTVTGPGGRQIVVSTAPAAAHYIDMANGGLFASAGVRQLGAILTYQPWDIPAGAKVSASISGSRSLAQRVRSTFV